MNVIFSNNSASVEGGGMRNENYSNPSLTNVIFSNNTAVRSGGGLENFHYSNPTLTNLTFSGNTASSGGGLMNWDHSDPVLTNVTFSANSAVDQGGAMYNGGNPSLINVTFSGNEASQGGGMFNAYGSEPSVTNSILYGNPGGDIFDVSGTRVVTYSIVQGGYPGTGNLDADPLLGPLQNNGGFTQTMALQSGSPAIDAGDDANCPAEDQRGVMRPLDGDGDGTATCDIGAYEVPEASTVSITADTPDPSVTNQNVAVTVTVSGGSSTPTRTVDITGADANCTITLSGGTGSCNVVFTRGGNRTLTAIYSGDQTHGASFDTEAHTVWTLTTLKSQSANDGWILESAETGNIGGIMNATATTLNLGDNAANRQYRAILSFNTSSLPDNAVITKVVLKVKRNSVVGNGDPVSLFQGFKVDIKKGAFGIPALELGDFSATAGKTYGPFNPSLSNGWYNLNLTNGKSYINKIGNTQFRLRFSLDDNNNSLANFLKLYSGNAAVATDRPQLTIQYYVP